MLEVASLSNVTARAGNRQQRHDRILAVSPQAVSPNRSSCGSANCQTIYHELACPPNNCDALPRLEQGFMLCWDKPVTDHHLPGRLPVLGLQWFAQSWHLSSAHNSHKLMASQTPRLLPDHTLREALLITSPVPIWCWLEPSHLDFLIGWSLMFILVTLHVIHKQYILMLASLSLSLTVDGCLYIAPASEFCGF